MSNVMPPPSSYKHPYAGGTLDVPLESKETLRSVAQAVCDGAAFPIDPDGSDLDPYMREAKISLGTMFMNFNVDAGNGAVFAIGWKGSVKIDVFRWSQSDEFLKILKDLGREDMTVYSVALPESRVITDPIGMDKELNRLRKG